MQSGVANKSELCILFDIFLTGSVRPGFEPSRTNSFKPDRPIVNYFFHFCFLNLLGHFLNEKLVLNSGFHYCFTYCTCQQIITYHANQTASGSAVSCSCGKDMDVQFI